MSCVLHRKKTTDSKVAVKEHGRSAVFLNEKREIYYVTVVDGGVVARTLSADRVISKIGKGDLIVELKGSDVEHAVKQVAATIEIVKSCERKRGPIAGLIVASRVPAEDTQTQRIRAKFRKEQATILKIVSGNREHRFDDFFA